MKRALAVVGVLALSCATTSTGDTRTRSPLEVAGVTLDEAAVTFEATSAAMRSANASLTPGQRAAWNAFAPRFDAGFRVAVRAWKAARAVGDANGQADAEATLTPLIQELERFENVLLGPALQEPGVGPPGQSDGGS